MLKLNGNNRSLETSKFFPYVAWTLTFGFALFVYNITMELRDVATDLQQQTQWLEEKINTVPNANTDFEA